MKTLLIALSVLALSVPAMAYPGPDSIGLYLDGNAPSVAAGDLTMNTSAGFESVTLYLCITNPSLGGVSGWEGLIEIEGSPIAPAWTLTAGLDVDADPDKFQVGIGLAPLALVPNDNGSVILADWTGFIGTTGDVVKFFIKGVPESVSFDMTPGYASPTNAGDLQFLFSNTGGPAVPVFCINEDCSSVANEDETWSNVKGMFR